jgi:hypothetical protein
MLCQFNSDTSTQYIDVLILECSASSLFISGVMFFRLTAILPEQILRLTHFVLADCYVPSYAGKRK